MVPTTRNLLHHDSRSSSKVPYCPPYSFITAQLEVASAPAAACGDLKPSRFPPWLAMADDDAVGQRRRRQGYQAEAAAGTSSRGGGGGDEDVGDGKDDWLQLGLSTASSSSSASTSSAGVDNDGTVNPAPAAPMELGLFAGKQSERTVRPPLFPLPIRSYHYQYGHGRYWPAAASRSMPTPFLPFARPLRSCSDDLMVRVVSPPPRTEAAGLWLTLQAAPNQVREPILPQIPKCYLRIKNINIKVEVVMKYLVDKLGLAQSHQVELTCRGQLLPPFLPVKYVRDSIWCSPVPREHDDEEAALSELPLPRRTPAAATTTDHVMTVFYSTSRNH